MAQKTITTCDNCGVNMDSNVALGWGYALSSRHVGDSSNVVGLATTHNPRPPDPLPDTKHFCRFKCLAEFVAEFGSTKRA